MCGNNDPRRLLRILNLRQGYVELHGKLETTLLGGKEAHTTVDRDVADLDALATTHNAPRAPSKQAPKPTAKSCSGFVPPPSPPISFGERSCASKAPPFVRP